MAKGIVSNVSRNPIELPDGSMLAAGETRSDFDESSLKSDNIFIKGGMLVVGKDAKALQSQLDDSGVEVKELQAQVASLQEGLQKETLRANEAQAKADAASPEKVAELERALTTANARADKAEKDLAELKKK